MRTLKQDFKHSPRQREVFEFIARIILNGGCPTRKEIAEATGMSIHTTGHHIRYLIRKNLITTTEEKKSRNLAVTFEGLDVYNNLMNE